VKNLDQPESLFSVLRAADPQFRVANATIEKEDIMLRDAIFQAARRGMPLVAPEGPAVPPGKNNQSASFAVQGITSIE
jgi:hypothetical protein